MHEDVIRTLSERGIQPSSQRVAIADFVLHTEAHPSADDVFNHVRSTLPVVSRATVYNTLNLFVEKGLLRELFLSEGKVVFDPNMTTHHHFIDDESGRIHDVDWNAVQVCNIEGLEGIEVRDYQVVIHGRRKPVRRKR